MSKRRWTEEEINTLISLAPKCYIREIAQILNRTESAVITKANKMELDYITLKRDYTQDELDYIKSNWGKVPVIEMSRVLKVSRTMVQRQADLMNLPKLGNNPYKKWTKKQIDKLEILAQEKTITELAHIFKTTKEAIQTVASRNGILLIDEKIHWTEEDNARLRELAKTMDMSEIATIMNRNTSAIRLQAKRQNIELMVNKKAQESIWTEENIQATTERMNLYIDEIKRIIDSYPNLTVHLHSINRSLVTILKEKIKNHRIGFIISNRDLNFIDVDYYVILSFGKILKKLKKVKMCYPQIHFFNVKIR